MAFVIPSIFTAVDKFSPAFQRMNASVDSFISKTETAVARSERGFKKMLPSVNSTFKHVSEELFAFASVASAAAGIVGTIDFSYESAERYEHAIKQLTASSGAGAGMMEEYEKTIGAVAEATKRGSSETAEAFSIVGSLNPALYKNADALGEVTKASITLSEATETSVSASAEKLTGIMRAFKAPAEDANKIINTLIATTNKGGISYDQLSTSIASIGETTRNANMSFEQTAAAIATVNKTTNLGSSSGAALEKVIIRLEKSHIGYKNGVFSLDAAIDQMNKKMANMNGLHKDAYLNSLGLRGATVGAARALISNKEAYDSLTGAVTGTNAAQEKSALMMDTVAGVVIRLKGAWDRIIKSSNKVGSALYFIKEGIRFVADHLDGLLKIVGTVIGVFVAWRTYTLLMRGALILMRAISAAFFLVDMIKYIASTQGLTFAQAAWAIIVESCTSAMAALNAVMLANPIGLIIIGIIALIALVAVIINKWNEWGAALTVFLGPLGFIISLVQSFRRNWDMITKAFQDGGILSGLKAIGKTMYDAILMPMQQLLSLIGRFTGADWATNMSNKIGQFRTNMGVNTTTDESGEPLQKPAINNSTNQHEALMEKIERTNNAQVDIRIRDPKGRTDAESNSPGVNIKQSSTMTWFGE